MQNNLFLPAHKEMGEENVVPSNSGHKSTFDSVPSRSVTPFSAVKNSLLVQIRGRRLLAACFLLQAGRQSDPTVDVMQAKYQNIWASV